MGKFRVELSKSATRELAKIQAKERNRILRRLHSLSEDPRPKDSKKLSAKGDMLRVREGDYRIVYEVEDQKLLVLTLRIGHRREVHRNLGALIGRIP